jgi:hypothetical protein
MNITYEDNKDCRCYRDLVDSEGGRLEIKEFSRHFGCHIVAAALRLHQRLKNAESAELYNNIAGAKNKIEKKEGQKRNEPLILKLRVQDAYRKLFYYIIAESGDGTICVEENWTGQFNKVKDIHVFDINKHKY